MKIRSFTATADGGMTVEHGKPQWPHCVRLRMPRWKAANMARELVAYLANADPAAEFESAIMGEIVEEDESTGEAWTVAERAK